MPTRTLEESPSLGGLYAKAVLPKVPLLGRVLRDAGARDMSAQPDLELRLEEIGFDEAHLAAYAEVCGFAGLGERVPATYPHVLAFPLHLELMTDPAFPFEVLGLLHVGNRIEQRRPLLVGDVIDLSVRAGRLTPHPRGTTVTLVSEAAVAGEVVWREESVLLRRQQTEQAAVSSADDSGGAEDVPAGPIRWRLPSDLGRRYAAVTGDRNPIHLSALTARAFGFRRPIAHGMWTKARALAALSGRTPDAFDVEVEFRKPVYLPGSVDVGARPVAGSRTEWRFAVTSQGRTHLVGGLHRR